MLRKRVPIIPPVEKGPCQREYTALLNVAVVEIRWLGREREWDDTSMIGIEPEKAVLLFGLLVRIENKVVRALVCSDNRVRTRFCEALESRRWVCSCLQIEWQTKTCRQNLTGGKKGRYSGHAGLRRGRERQVKRQKQRWRGSTKLGMSYMLDGNRRARLDLELQWKCLNGIILHDLGCLGIYKQISAWTRCL